MLKYIKERLNDFDANTFINELVLASKNLGILEARIISYQFNSILIPLLHKKEAISSMKIEGTQTTMPEVLQKEIDPKSEDDKIQIEVSNHVEALLFGSDHLRYEGFSHSFIQKIHEIMMKGILPEHLLNTLGKYKRTDNRIVNSSGTVVFKNVGNVTYICSHLFDRSCRFSYAGSLCINIFIKLMNILYNLIYYRKSFLYSSRMILHLVLNCFNT